MKQMEKTDARELELPADDGSYNNPSILSEEDDFMVAVAKTCGSSYPLAYDEAFIATNAQRVADHLSSYRGSEVELVGFTPFWRTCEGHGVMVMEFRGQPRIDSVFELLIAFGGKRQSFDVSSDIGHLDGKVENESIYVKNWDELWAIVCRIAELMDVTRVTIRYGT